MPARSAVPGASFLLVMGVGLRAAGYGGAAGLARPAVARRCYGLSASHVFEAVLYFTSVSCSTLMVMCRVSVNVRLPVSPAKLVMLLSCFCRSAGFVDLPVSIACLRM